MGIEAKYGRIQVEDSPTPIPDGEPLFLLRGQDILAPIAVRYYADLREAQGDKIGAEHIRKQADRMASWPNRKMPD